jgi:hypothetical protein
MNAPGNIRRVAMGEGIGTLVGPADARERIGAGA